MNAAVFMLSMFAASPTPHRSGAEILHDLRKLSVVGTALYVAAHPDDENTRLLASLANDTQVRAAYLSMTRGEGGQNLIGPELGAGLGVIRTQELLAARRIDGAEQYFTRARDFGYSKSVEETLQIWDHVQILRDVVFAIRALRPDVIITRFNQEGGDTHGHHTASARIALEAFELAGKASYEPALGAPWLAKRILWNAWRPDPNEKPLGDAIQMRAGAYSALLGTAFGEMAADSRSMHKSQGFGAAQAHVPSQELFVPLAGAPGKSLFDGVDLTWARVPGSASLGALLKKAERDFKVIDPSASVPVLVQALEAMRAMPENDFKAQKLRGLTQAITDCAGLFIEATASEFITAPGEKIEVITTVFNRSPAALTLKEIALTGASSQQINSALENGVASTQKATVKVPENAALSNPHWLDLAPENGMWRVSDSSTVNMAELPAALQAQFTFGSGKSSFTVSRPVVFKWVDPTVGERVRPVEIVPPVTVKTDTGVLLFEAPGVSKPLKVTLTAMAPLQDGSVTLRAMASREGDPLMPSKPFTLKKRGDTAEVTFEVAPAYGTLVAEVHLGAAVFSQGLKRIDYPHIPIQTTLPRAEVKLMRLDLKKGGKRIGYIAGAGDEVPEALRQVGYEVSILSDEVVGSKPLGAFDAIVIGIRAYNVKPAMPVLYAALMKYVSDGGTVVAQYNTKNWLSNVPAQMGPYPFEVSQDRVTDELAAVAFELPKHAVLNVPNVITAADFDGWVQERGLYFAADGSWGAKYETPLSMHDFSEPPRKGSLLIAKHGRGVFIYTGLAFFRQLPAGVPGAYRLFANLLAAHGS